MHLTDEGGKEEGLEYMIKKKPRTDLCEHQHQRSLCKDCGGSSPCEHRRQRSNCNGGSDSGKKPCTDLCEHQRQRSQCKDCGGGGICEHQRVRSPCKDCGNRRLCEQQRIRSKYKASTRGRAESANTAVAVFALAATAVFALAPSPLVLADAAAHTHTHVHTHAHTLLVCRHLTRISCCLSCILFLSISLPLRVVNIHLLTPLHPSICTYTHMYARTHAHQFF